MKNNIFKIFFLFSLLLVANNTFAYGTITNYSRTPNTDIEQGNTYTIEYDISYPSLTVAGETFSAIVTYSQSSSGLNNFYHCTTAGPTSTHVSFTTAALTEIEDYTRIKAELNYDDAYCTDPGTFPGIGVNVEYNSGAVIFSVVEPPPTGNCDPVDKVCYYDWLFMNLVFVFLISSFIFTGYVSFFFPKKKEKEE